MSDIDLVEINEAFAAQVIPSYQDLEIPIEKLNVNGGAIAVGHPFGMPGRVVDGDGAAPAGPHHGKPPEASRLDHAFEITYPGLVREIVGVSV